ncbi:MAG: hypothetical protein M0R46_16225 [Candidatus Muirbacterium halophilum]|nr:hypothetical protein [Candidatus Muirbacterium halophilum]MCK9477464.1 hypothetical protein [Candidatus Muirbacterium halophilum]
MSGYCQQLIKRNDISDVIFSDEIKDLFDERDQDVLIQKSIKKMVFEKRSTITFKNVAFMYFYKSKKLYIS